MSSFPPGGSTSSPLSRHFSHCVAEIIYAYVLAELGKFCLNASGHTFQTKLYRMHLHNNIQNWWLNPVLTPSRALLRSLNISLTLQANPTVLSFDSGWECYRIPDCLSVWLSHCMSVCLSVWPVDMQLHKYPQQEQQQLRFRLLFRALCRHTFSGEAAPLFAPRRAHLLFVLLFVFYVFLCVHCMSGSHVLTTSQNTGTN